MFGGRFLKKKEGGGVGRRGAWVELVLLASGMLGYETLGGVVVRRSESSLLAGA
jgi:hypothetical protein